MKLYHGSNMAVTLPEIRIPDRKLDFGAGFYLTSSREQAERWAKLTTLRKKAGAPTLSIFDFNESAASGLNCLRFAKADGEWLRFVAANRSGRPVPDGYDLVVGPVANDKTYDVISLYFAGVYDEEETVKRLEPQKLFDQFAFRTAKALGTIAFASAERT